MTHKYLVTGGTGFIGSWIVKMLLEQGAHVKINVRNLNKKEKYEHLQKIADNSKGTLEVFEANLLDTGAFDSAASDVNGIFHVASPFKIKVKNPQLDLVDPALKGTENVLSAANKSNSVRKIVLTSSCAAIYGDNRDMTDLGLKEFTEKQYNTTSNLGHQAYSYSKTVAEKKAWEIAKSQNNWKLVVINPSFVLGPSLTKYSGSESINVVRDVLKGKHATGAPNMPFGLVDVRDIAKAHILAMENENANGRHIISNQEGDFLDIANSIEKSFPKKYKLPKKHAPKWLLMILGWMFGVTRNYVKNNVGWPLKFNNNKSKKELGLTYTSLDVTIKDMVDSMS